MPRIGTMAQYDLSLFYTLRTQNKVYETQTQIDTNKKSQDYAGIAKDSQALVTMKAELARTEQYREDIQIVDQRLDLMALSLSQTTELARDFRTTLQEARNGSQAAVTELPTQAANFKDQVVELLNMKDATRYLFGGGRTDVAPVDGDNVAAALNVPPLPAEGAGDPGEPIDPSVYYDGDQVTQSLQASDDFYIDYGIKADEPAFANVLGAMQVIADETFAEPLDAGNLEAIDTAVYMLNQALDGGPIDGRYASDPVTKTLDRLSTDVSLDKLTLERTDERLELLGAQQTDNIGDIENINRVEAITQFNQYNNQLEASYSAMVRVQNTTLLNYL